MSEEKETRAGKETRVRRGALGKGYNSLLGLSGDLEDVSASVKPGPGGNAVISIPVTNIEPNPLQPRKFFRESDLRDLARSLSEEGVVQPLIVIKGQKDAKYTLIAGERRWRAARLAGLDHVPAIVKDYAPEEMLRVALIENIQRADLNIIEEAEAYKVLIDDFGLTQDQCAKKVGKERPTVANALRILALPKEIQEDLIEDRLTMGHGRALLTFDDKKLMLRARDLIVKKQLNVRQAEQLCKAIKKQGDIPPESARTGDVKNADLEYLVESLRTHLRTKVKLSGNGSRGKIEVSYFSAGELERILGIVGLKL